MKNDMVTTGLQLPGYTITQLCEETRSETYHLMVNHAERNGANAIIGVRYDATEVMAGLTEVLCYGTAVLVEPDAAH